MRVSNIHIKLILRILLFFFVIFISWQSAFAQTKEVVAQKGDGIHKMLMRNGMDISKYTDPFIELNKTRLGEKNTLYAGIKYRLPDTEEIPEGEVPMPSMAPMADPKPNATFVDSPSKDKPLKPATSASKALNFNLFGTRYANVEVKDNALKGAVYYLTSGHGGPDPGAMGKYQGHVVCEDEYAYDVTLRMARNLVEHGATVYMIVIDKNDGIRDDAFLTPDKDEVTYPNQTIPLNQVKRLHQRVEVINQLYNKNGNKFQRFIEIHVDSRSKGENVDLFFYHDPKSKKGEEVAIILQKTFQNKYKEVQPNRGYSGTVSERNLYVLKNTYPVGVFIELANMNHERDIKRLIIPDNRQAVANWLTLGLISDYKSNK